MAQEKFKRKLTTIFSADVAGYSRLMGEDEAATVKTLEQYKGIMSELIHQHRGRVVDSPGDNLLSEFTSVVDAVQCAVATQKELLSRNAELPETRRMQFRIGVNLGDVIEEEGAKILERKNGQSITLRYLDRKSIILEDGDIVHRHMMDGDAILFNRQPTLHRMSMMCHIAKIMKRGDTFRMNVADTKPYNADFDGDEMNLHMPQDPESESELKNLAAVPYQIISPANNSSIIGIYQDSMLGSYRFTREKIDFTQNRCYEFAYDV